MHLFPGETEASLRDAWKRYGDEGRRLYDAWEATAGEDEE
jgi:hypothetical protein